jgi:hypothetical protein
VRNLTSGPVLSLHPLSSHPGPLLLLIYLNLCEDRYSTNCAATYSQQGKGIGLDAIIFLEKLRRGKYIRPPPCRLAVNHSPANLGFLGPLSLVAGSGLLIRVLYAQVLSSFSASTLKPISDDERSPNVEGKFASPQLWS